MRGIHDAVAGLVVQRIPLQNALQVVGAADSAGDNQVFGSCFPHGVDERLHPDRLNGRWLGFPFLWLAADLAAIAPDRPAPVARLIEDVEDDGRIAFVAGGGVLPELDIPLFGHPEPVKIQNEIGSLTRSERDGVIHDFAVGLRIVGRRLRRLAGAEPETVIDRKAHRVRLPINQGDLHGLQYILPFGRPFEAGHIDSLEPDRLSTVHRDKLVSGSLDLRGLRRQREHLFHLLLVVRLLFRQEQRRHGNRIDLGLLHRGEPDPGHIESSRGRLVDAEDDIQFDGSLRDQKLAFDLSPILGVGVENHISRRGLDGFACGVLELEAGARITDERGAELHAARSKTHEQVEAFDAIRHRHELRHLNILSGLL